MAMDRSTLEHNLSTSSTTVTPGAAEASPKASVPLPLLLLLVTASGCAALIYEVVWYQLLPLAIGSTSVSLGILLAAFMGGLCIGSLWLPRVLPAGRALRVYAGLELGIAALAIVVLYGLPFLDRVYVAGAEHGLPGMLLRGALAGICLLPPTILMGASFPVIVRSAEGRRAWNVGAWGLLYGANTTGAVFGCLFAGFYLLRIYNMPTATYVAVAINVAVALLALAISKRTEEEAVEPMALRVAPRGDAASMGPVYLTIALSGACALAAEVVWTRLLGMLLLGTVYVFSIILAVFLVGIAVGSGIGSALIKRVNPRYALGWCQVLLTLTVAWAAYAIVSVVPFFHDNVLVTNDAWQMYAMDLKRCLFALLPAPLLWGASFPLACAAAARSDEDPGVVAGDVYAANTAGGIVGALLMSLLLIPWIGSQQGERILIAGSLLAGLVVLLAAVRESSKSA